MPQTFNFKVEMTCGGCENAVRNSLRKNLGDKLIDLQIDLTSRKVTVVIEDTKQWTDKEMLELIFKCGKTSTVWSA